MITCKRRVISLFLAVCLMLTILSFPAISHAGQDTQALAAAQRLYQMGLFRGTGNDSDGNPVFELDRAPDRNESVTMLIRLLGLEESALATQTETPFNDLASWARPYVGMAYHKCLTAGTSAVTYDGGQTVSASQYLTFILRALGYSSDTDFKWDKAWELTDQLGITFGEYDGNSVFLRGDAAIVSERALYVKIKGSDKTLMEVLSDERTEGSGETDIDSEKPALPDSSGNSPAENDTAGTIVKDGSNTARIQALDQERGVQILTGSDADIWVSGRPVTGITDEETISDWLDLIEKELDRYPKDFFKDMQDITDCRIFLMSFLPGDVSGITSYEFGDHVSISLNAAQVTLTSDRTLNHEIMHFISHYINMKTGGTDALFTIENIVPSAAYDVSDNSYTYYDTSLDYSDMYFVTPYAKTSASEDMAETFADAMFRSYKKEYMKDPSWPIYRKLQIISDSIRRNIPSAAQTPAGSLPWERWL